MYKWMVEFLSKFKGSGIKVDRVSSIRVAKSLISFNILRVDDRKETSSRDIVFFAMSLRLVSLVNILWLISLYRADNVLYWPTLSEKHLLMNYIL